MRDEKGNSVHMPGLVHQLSGGPFFLFANAPQSFFRGLQVDKKYHKISIDQGDFGDFVMFCGFGVLEVGLAG